MRSSEFDVLEALKKPVCAVCHLSDESAVSYLKGVISDGVNAPPVRDDWRRRGGLCPRHWRAFRWLENPTLPAAIFSEDLLESYLEGGVPAASACPACEVEARAATRFLVTLRRVDAARVAEELRTGRGFLCLKHLAELPENDLATLFRNRLRGIIEELREFQRKHDYRFAGEGVGPERDSWLRAIRALGGEV